VYEDFPTAKKASDKVIPALLKEWPLQKLKFAIERAALNGETKASVPHDPLSNLWGYSNQVFQKFMRDKGFSVIIAGDHTGCRIEVTWDNYMCDVISGKLPMPWRD
jgi:hypothetical protein